MSSKSLNKVELIGNLTRDPELKYTPQGTAVCDIGLATNRSWTTPTGEIREDVQFHKIVAWRKLAELAGQLLKKGRKVYIEGSLAYRKYVGKDGVERTTTEIVMNDFILMDNKSASTSNVAEVNASESNSAKANATSNEASAPSDDFSVEDLTAIDEQSSGASDDDIPF